MLVCKLGALKKKFVMVFLWPVLIVAKVVETELNSSRRRRLNPRINVKDLAGPTGGHGNRYGVCYESQADRLSGFVRHRRRSDVGSHAYRILRILACRR